MSVYRLIPKTVIAIQWTYGVSIPHAIEASNKSVYVHTPTGKVKLLPNDYVIGDAAGKQIVMSASDFEAKYELEDVPPTAEEGKVKAAKARKAKLARERRAANKKSAAKK